MAGGSETPIIPRGSCGETGAPVESGVATVTGFAGDMGKASCTHEHYPITGDLSSAVQGHCFAFFSGIPVASFRNESADPLDRVQRAWSAAGQGLFTLRDRGALRADLGQSQSGNSSLSPQAYRVENTTADWAVSEIGPITSVPAPRDFGGRSLKGAKVCLAGGALELGLGAIGALHGGLTWFALGAGVALLIESIVMAPTLVRELRRPRPGVSGVRART